LLVLKTFSCTEIVSWNTPNASISNGIIFGTIRDCVDYTLSIVQVESWETTGTFISLELVGNTVLGSIGNTLLGGDIQVESIFT
jgi:hypothetical protein